MGKKKEEKLSLHQRAKSQFYSLDRYPRPIALNFNKRPSIPTIPGVIASVIVLSLVLIYSYQKFTKWVYR